MKKVMLAAAVIAASLIATKSYSQVYVNAHIGIGVPGPRVYVEQPPVCAAPAPVYEGGYYAAPEVCESEYPGYVYYEYPAWYGHYRDRVYFQHYRPYFERDHRGYFYGRRFDNERWEHDGDWGHGHGWGHHREDEDDQGEDHDHGRGWGHGHGWGHDREGWDRHPDQYRRW